MTCLKKISFFSKRDCGLIISMSTNTIKVKNTKGIFNFNKGFLITLENGDEIFVGKGNEDFFLLVFPDKIDIFYHIDIILSNDKNITLSGKEIKLSSDYSTIIKAKNIISFAA